MSGSPPKTDAEAIPASASDIFHRVSRLIQEEQEIVKIPPEMTAEEALAKMKESNFSQLPVMVNGEVLGMFSYRSFSLKMSELDAKVNEALNMPVHEMLEKPTYAWIDDEFTSIIEDLDRKDVVLIGNQRRLQAVVTPMDVIRYLHNVASAFVLLEEIELSLRELVRSAVDRKTLGDCAVACLKHYDAGKVPTNLENMTLHDVVQIVRDGRNWDKFQSVFGCPRDHVGAQLRELPKMRNAVFHFRQGVTLNRHEKLVSIRDWLLLKLRICKARAAGPKGETNA